MVRFEVYQNATLTWRSNEMKKLFQLAIAMLAIPASSWAGSDPVSFDMIVSAGGAVCAPYAHGSVTITPAGPVAPPAAGPPTAGA